MLFLNIKSLLYLIERILCSYSGAVKSVCIAPDSKTFASGSYDKTVRIWRMNDGEQLHVLEGIFTFIIYDD